MSRSHWWFNIWMNDVHCIIGMTFSFCQCFISLESHVIFNYERNMQQYLFKATENVSAWLCFQLALTWYWHSILCIMFLCLHKERRAMQFSKSKMPVNKRIWLKLHTIAILFTVTLLKYTFPKILCIRHICSESQLIHWKHGPLLLT